MEIGELMPFVRKRSRARWRRRSSTTLVERLQHVVDIGLEYLSLNRETDTLSGGESQRVKMVKHLGSSLVDVMYIFDEPSVGLHPRDVHRLNELLQKLRDKGNTVHRGRARPGRDQGRRPRRGRRAACRARAAARSSSRAATPDLLQCGHADGAAPAAGAAAQGRRPRKPSGKLPIKQRARQQPAERQRRHPDRRADGDHRRGGLGQELADQRGVPAPASRRRS